MRDIMTEKKKYIAQKEKKELRLKLYKRDRSNCHYCHYCGIEEEDFFRNGGKRRKLEVDRKDNQKDYSKENCVLSCPICNSEYWMWLYMIVKPCFRYQSGGRFLLRLFTVGGY